jgi:hypothetical protein
MPFRTRRHCHKSAGGVTSSAHQIDDLRNPRRLHHEVRSKGREVRPQSSAWPTGGGPLFLLKRQTAAGRRVCLYHKSKQRLPTLSANCALMPHPPSPVWMRPLPYPIMRCPKGGGLRLNAERVNLTIPGVLPQGPPLPGRRPRKRAKIREFA